MINLGKSEKFNVLTDVIFYETNFLESRPEIKSRVEFGNSHTLLEIKR